jgi:hypothetical protein
MNQKVIYNCYIDESGCEGWKFQKGSMPWFLLSAIIVREDQDRDVGNSVQEFVNDYYLIKKNNPPTNIHWIDLSGSARLSYVQHIAKKPFSQVVVAIWKEKHDRATYINRAMYLYRFAFKLLAERVSWHVDQYNGWAKIVISEGKAINLNELKRYLSGEMGKSNNSIKPVFDPRQIRESTMKKTVMLRVADACASAFGNAFNPDRKRGCRPEYANHLVEKLCRSNRSHTIFTFGLKILPADLERKELICYYPFIAEWLKK